MLFSLITHFVSKLPPWKGLAKYYDVDQDNTSDDLVLLMEHIDIMTARKYIEVFGVIEICNVRIIVYQMLSLLKDLIKIDCYHGRLNLNNIHFDSQFNVKITDYGLMRIFDKEAQFTTEEGSRFDIFCLGIWVLKILGKINLDQGSDHSIDVFLENLEALKYWYHLVSKFLSRLLIL